MASFRVLGLRALEKVGKKTMIFDFIRKRLDPMWKKEKAFAKSVRIDKKLEKRMRKDRR